MGKLPKRNLLVARVLIGFVICLNPVQGQSGTSNLGTASTNGTTGRWPNVIVNFLVDGRGHAPPRQVTASSLRVLDDGVEQKIQAFSGPGGPVSLCIEIDVSGSMKSNHDNVADAAKQLVKNLPPGSEVMVVAFNKKPSLVAPFTPANDFDLTLFDRMHSLWRTALDDSTIFAEQYFVQHARYRLRALVLISDGGENASKQSFGATIRAMEAPGSPLVYGIQVVPPDPATPAERLAQFFRYSPDGVRIFRAANSEEFARARAQVSQCIEAQSALSYTSPLASAGKRLHKVKVTIPGFEEQVRIESLPGYYVPRP